MKYLVYTLNLLTVVMINDQDKNTIIKGILLDPSRTNILNARKKKVTEENTAETNQNSNIG